jgi:transposase
VARAIGPRKVKWYSEEFKVTAVKLSSLAGVLIQDVARELDIHPFMLSRWRKEVREGKIVAVTKELELDPKAVAELQRLRAVERDYARLREEHALLKKAIRFCSERRQRSSRLSTVTGRSIA